MLVRTLKVSVHADHETLWNLLLDRLQHPELYITGMTQPQILETDGHVTVREMKLHGDLVRERVTVRPYDNEIRHELLEHPRFTGAIVTRIVPTARQSPVAPLDLEFDLELVQKSWQVPSLVYGEAEVLADIQEEMNRIKARAEALEARA